MKTIYLPGWLYTSQYSVDRHSNAIDLPLRIRLSHVEKLFSCDREEESCSARENSAVLAELIKALKKVEPITDRLIEFCQQPAGWLWTIMTHGL